MVHAPESARTVAEGEAEDVLNQLAGLAPDAPIAQLRAERPEVVRATQGSYRALLEPDDPAGVSRYEREMIAFRVAVLTPSLAVAAWHRARLQNLGASDAALAAIEHFPDGSAHTPRAEAILRETDRLTRAPGTATPAHIVALKTAGLSPRDIVTIAQLIAFMSFAVRTLVGLRLLAEGA